MLSTLDFSDANMMTVVQVLPAAPQTVSPFVILYAAHPDPAPEDLYLKNLLRRRPGKAARSQAKLVSQELQRRVHW